MPAGRCWIARDSIFSRGRRGDRVPVVWWPRLPSRPARCVHRPIPAGQRLRSTLRVSSPAVVGCLTLPVSLRRHQVRMPIAHCSQGNTWGSSGPGFKSRQPDEQEARLDHASGNCGDLAVTLAILVAKLIGNARLPDGRDPDLTARVSYDHQVVVLVDNVKLAPDGRLRVPWMVTAAILVMAAICARLPRLGSPQPGRIVGVAHSDRLRDWLRRRDRLLDRHRQQGHRGGCGGRHACRVAVDIRLLASCVRGLGFEHYFTGPNGPRTPRRLAARPVRGSAPPVHHESGRECWADQRSLS